MSFFSLSAPCIFPSSLKKSLPGPHVGKADKEQTIFPPVAESADKAAFSVGSSAGSGCLISENRVGSCVRRAVMTSLYYGDMIRHKIIFCLNLWFNSYLDS